MSKCKKVSLTALIVQSYHCLAVDYPLVGFYGGFRHPEGGERRRKEGNVPCLIPNSNTVKHGDFPTVEVLINEIGDIGRH